MLDLREVDGNPSVLMRIGDVRCWLATDQPESDGSERRAHRGHLAFTNNLDVFVVGSKNIGTAGGHKTTDCPTYRVLFRPNRLNGRTW
jgi:hypothetical protein